ncbi:MAG TPA: sialidase family protein [Gemmatimonadaceae bacterium]
MRSLRPAALLAAVVGLACASPPVEWGEAVVLDALPAIGASRLGEGDAPRFADAATAPTQPRTACAESVRIASGAGDERYAVWWALREDSSAALLGARSGDGGETWDDPVPVDTLDRSHRGCARPAPSIAVDSATGYVHVAYWLEAPEGAGIFFSHSMEPDPLFFHAPVVIVYGDRPAQTAIAAERSIVAVAYQDPNARVARIAMHVSRSDGHIFEHRIPPLTPSAESAFAPRVAIHGRRVALAWRGELRRSGAVERSAAYLRTGRLR